jgi:hypothetical protein
MRSKRTIGRIAGAGLALAVAVGAARSWLVPMLIVRVLQTHYAGHITIRDWWIDARSAGVRGVILREGPAATSPAWASAEVVKTDLGLRALLLGRFSPGSLTVISPSVTLRAGRDGRLLTRVPLVSRGGGGAVPTVTVRGARVTFQQEGRPEMTITGIAGRVRAEAGAEVLAAAADDPRWGSWTARGRFDSQSRAGGIELNATRVTADHERIARIPFVPSEVWTHVVPSGPLDVAIGIRLASAEHQSPQVKTTVTCRGTNLGLPKLGLVSAETCGRIVIEGGRVWLEKLRGAAMGGRVEANGTLDFAQRPARIDLALVLSRINVAESPASWRPGKVEITGQATGDVQVRAFLGEVVDLSGSFGRAVVEGTTVQGIAVKSLSLTMQAERDGVRHGGGQARGGLRLPRSIMTAFELEDVDLAHALAGIEAVGMHVPIPIAGRLSVNAEATIPLGRLEDARAWTASGQVRSEQIRYQGTTFDGIGAAVVLKDGLLEVSDVTARLEGKRLTARGDIELAAPRAFHARCDVTGWDIGEVLALAPAVPSPAPVAGTLTGHAQAAGTLSPWSLSESSGQGKLGDFRAGPIRLGDVPFHWAMERAAIVVSGVEAHPLGGSVTAWARVPTQPGEPIEGEASVRAVDLGQLSGALLDDRRTLRGLADGRIAVRVARRPAGADNSPLLINVDLKAPDLVIQGVEARSLQAVLTMRRGVLAYDAVTDSLGGKFRIKGDMPLGTTPAGGDARVQAVGFQLAALWKALGNTGEVTKLHGTGAIDANVRMHSAGSDVRGSGLVELRDLRWDDRYALGALRGVFTGRPACWRIDPIDGELVGSPVHGRAAGETPSTGLSRAVFGLDFDHVSLKRVLAPLPHLARHIEGAGRLRLSGRLEDSTRLSAVATLDRAKLFGLPVTELRAPAELDHPPGGPVMVDFRHVTGRLANGRLHADAHIHLGSERTLQATVRLADLEIETLARLFTASRRPASGMISGHVSLASGDLADPRRLRGKILLDLDDACLGDVPVFRELDRFLGAARGGVFDDGDLQATIANRLVVVDQLTLAGPLVQLSATGTVGFDTQVNLEVLINTNQIISQSGQSLIGLIPGLGEVLGRRDQATSRVSGFLNTRLLKLRVTGTLGNPQVNADPAIVASEAAVGFFASVLKLPLELVR